jgi:tetratricopeptide (TPR) repeat protein
MMKKVISFVVFFVVAALIVVVVKLLQCGPGKLYNETTDKTIEDLKGKIEELEKEKIKDTKAMNSLANNYTRLGTIYNEKRLWDPAIEFYEKGIQYGKDTPGVYYSIGLAYGNRGSERDSKEDIDKAERYYRKAIEKQSDYSDAQNALAILLFYNKNEKGKALSLIEEVIGHNRKNYLARFTQARFYYEMDNLPRALSIYEDLSADLEKLPPSQVREEYKQNCAANIQQIMMETGKKKKKSD